MGRADVDQEKDIREFYGLVALPAPWGKHTGPCRAPREAVGSVVGRETVGKPFYCGFCR